MIAEKILESILDNFAKKSIMAREHQERKKYDRTAYFLIRELYGYEDLENIKRWDKYYMNAKRVRR